MILSGIIAASGRNAGPPSPYPPPAPVYGIVGEPNADGTAGGTHNFQASTILAQRYTTGVAGKIVALRSYFRGTGTPSFRMSLYGDAGSRRAVSWRSWKVRHRAFRAGTSARPGPPPGRERNHFGQSLFC